MFPPHLKFSSYPHFSSKLAFKIERNISTKFSLNDNLLQFKELATSPDQFNPIDKIITIESAHSGLQYESILDAVSGAVISMKSVKPRS